MSKSSLEVWRGRVKHEVHNDRKYKISKMSLGEILTYLRQDGSVVIDPQGNWLGAGVYFKTEGGRKKSAEEIARGKPLPQNGHKGDGLRVHGAHIFVVSQDGGLFFYSNAIHDVYTTPPPRPEDKGSEKYLGVRLDFLPIDEAWMREHFSASHPGIVEGDKPPRFTEVQAYKYTLAQLKEGLPENRLVLRLIDLAGISRVEAHKTIEKAKEELRTTGSDPSNA